MNTIIVNPNAVPADAPRKANLPKGILYRFGYQPIQGSGLCRVGECVTMTEPPVETLRGVVEKYSRENGISEQFNPADYGYEE